MLFHVSGIKETLQKKYNLDIVIDLPSEEDVKSLLKNLNIIILNLYVYNKPIESFWNLQIKTENQWSQAILYSYITDVQSACEIFTNIGFNITYVNFIQWDILSEDEIKNIIQKTKIKAQENETETKKIIEQKQEKETKIYKDQRLEKILKIADSASNNIEMLLQKVQDKVSKDKIRDINQMAQELTKLKMWRNDDKMSELLEKIYDKISDINEEYLEYMQKHIEYPIKDSFVSNIDIISENTKIKKAFKIKAIWAQRDFDDNYYLSFEYLGVYLKLIFKDIIKHLKFFDSFVAKIPSYIEICIILLIIFTWIYYRADKIFALSTNNLSWFAFLVNISLFWVVIYYFKKLIKKKLYINLLIVWSSIVVYLLLFWLIRINFAF